MVACPYCLGFKPATSTSLQSLYPSLAKEWDQEKNEFLPEQFNAKSRYEAWWKCRNGHSWKASIFNRTQRNLRCPKCGDAGMVSLSARCPDLLRNWDYQNNEVPCEAVAIGSEAKFYWRCSKCHGSFRKSVSEMVSSHFEGTWLLVSSIDRRKTLSMQEVFVVCLL